MSQENVEIVQGLYEAWNRGNLMWDSIDPDIEVKFAGGILKGTYRGRAGLTEALDLFWTSFEESRIDVESFERSGDDVLVTLRYFARGKTSGMEVNASGRHIWTVLEGRCVRWLILDAAAERE
jgi:ketosteroid isomerase-like protein